MKKIFSFLLVTILTISSSLFAQYKKPYKIIDTYYGWDITFNELMNDLERATIVIIGEEHNDSIAHIFQYDVLKALRERRGNENIFFSMEMFERDVQSIMNEYLNGWISEKNFVKDARVWNNYKDYRPMVEFCKENKIPVICANTPSRYVNMVTRNSLKSLKDLPRDVKRNFLPPLPIDTLKGAYSEKFWSIMGDPAHVTPQMRFLYQSQNLWDATMAHSIIESLIFNPRHTVLHINGRFHSDEYLGVTYRVKKEYPKGGQVITITCIPINEYHPDEHKGLADFVILTLK